MNIALVRYVLKGALRDRFVLSLVIAILLAISLSVFLGSATYLQETAFALVFAASSLRLIGSLGLVLFCVFFIRRSFEARDIESLLTRPISRMQLILSYSTALALLAIFLGVFQAFAILALGKFTFSYGLWIWSASIIVENIIMVNVALFFAIILNSAVSASMASIGLYVLGRMMGQILGVLSGHAAVKYQFLEGPAKLVSMFMPRLDLMGQSSWIIYGNDNIDDIVFVIMQGVSFLLLIFAGSLFDFVRKQF